MRPVPTQVFVRNAEGKIWGPIEPQSVLLLLEGGLLVGPLEVSINGLDFTTPDLVPEFADEVPRELWEPLRKGPGPNRSNVEIQRWVDNVIGKIQSFCHGSP